MNEMFMEFALEKAKIALKKNEVPVGCVIVIEDKVISFGYNEREKSKNATSHAEIIAISRACKKLKSWRLSDCDIYVTLEPCPMCSGAIIGARFKNLYFGAYDIKTGAAGSVLNLFDDYAFNHKVNIEGGILEKESKSLLSYFFKELRGRKS